jgi:Calcineurin-like phosphoesterase
LVLSDLHDDLWADSGRNLFSGIECAIGDLDHQILAGDLPNKPKVRWKQAFKKLSQLLPLSKDSIFPGNHDLYDFRFDGKDRFEQIVFEFELATRKRSSWYLVARVFFARYFGLILNRARGVPLTKDTSLRMNDYRHIRVAAKGYRRLRASDVVSNTGIISIGWSRRSMNLSTGHPRCNPPCAISVGA